MPISASRILKSISSSLKEGLIEYQDTDQEILEGEGASHRDPKAHGSCNLNMTVRDDSLSSSMVPQLLQVLQKQ